MDLGKQRARVQIGGRLFDSFADKGLFVRLTVTLRTGEASEAEWTVYEGEDENEFAFLDALCGPRGIESLESYAWLGYGDAPLGEPVFSGLLAEAGQRGRETTLRFYDHSFVMRIDQKSEPNHRGTDIQIMRKLVERNGLKFDVAADVKGVVLRAKKQQAQTDWQLFSELAREAGLVTYTRGRTVYARRPARTTEPVFAFRPRDVVVLEGGEWTHRLPEGREGRPGKVELRTTRSGGAVVRSVSDQSPRGHKRQVAGKSVAKGLTQSELQRRAQAKKELEREHAFTGSVQTYLLTDVRADVRQTVEAEDHGKLFSGRYLIDQLVFDFGPGQLSAAMDLYRDTDAF